MEVELLDGKKSVLHNTSDYLGLLKSFHTHFGGHNYLSNSVKSQKKIHNHKILL
jgi:hypothetical protein